MNNPYQQQMYNSYIPQYVNNPYLQQRYYQQPQTELQGISGRVVQTAESINANDVPMDGSKAFFPKQDLSEIYVKGWNADGTINTITYKPLKDDFSKQTGKTIPNTEKEVLGLSDEVTDLFQENFEKLFEKIEKLEERIDKNISSQKKTTRTQAKESE